MSHNWSFIIINNNKYLIKFNQNEENVECILTNLKIAWNEQITLDCLLERGRVSYHD